MYLDPIRFPDAWDRVIFKGVSTPVPGKVVVSGWSRKNEYDVKVGKGTAGATETLKGQPPASGTITFYAWTPRQFRLWDPILDVLKFDPSKGGNAATAAPAKDTGSNFAVGSASNTGAASGASGAGQTGTIPSPGAAGAPKKGDGWPTNTGGNAQPSLSAAYAIEVFHPALADIGVHFVLPPEELGIWEAVDDGGLYKRDIKFLEFAQAKGNVATTPTGADSPGDNFTTGGDPNGGGNNGAAAPAASGSAKGAGKDAQGAWGAK